MSARNSYFVTRLIYIIIIALVLINAYVVVPGTLSFGKGIIADINMPGVWRSARFAASSNTADFILFLREQIPEDGRVVIPPGDVANRLLTNTPHMQFFLAPREVINCTSIDCGRMFLGQENTYILIVGMNTFPGPEIRGQPQKTRMLNDTWGVYGPESGLGQGSEHDYISSFWDGFRLLFIPLLVILFLLAAGFLFGQWTLPRKSVWFQLGAGFGLITGALSVISYLTLIIFPSPSLNILFYGFLLVLGGLMFVGRLTQDEGRPFIDFKLLQGQFSIWVFAFIALGVLYGFLAVGSGYHATDAIVLWGVKGVGIGHKGLTIIPRWGTNTTNYPLNIPLLIAVFTETFGPALPFSKIIFPLFYFSLLMVIFGFLSESLGKNHAGLVTLALALSPLMVRHARIGYANLPLTFYLVTGVLLSSRVQFSQSGKGQRRYYWLSAIYYLLAVWTRPEGVILVMAVLFSSLGSYFSMDTKMSWKDLMALFFPAFIFWGFWKVTSIPYQIENGAGGMLDEVIRTIGRGELRITSLGRVLWFFFRQLFNIHTWAVLGIGLALAILTKGQKRTYDRHRTRFIKYAGLITVVTIIFMYYAFGFGPIYDLDWWLGSGFNRMILPGMTMLWIGISMHLFPSQET